MARNKLYEGKAKVLYEGPHAGTIIQYFKDDTTAGNGEKFAEISGKGVLNNRISEYIMLALEDMGVYTHFIKVLNMREQLVRACDIIPVEVIIRNVTAGSFSKRYGVEDGLTLPTPLIEFCLKSDKLGDPVIAEDHIASCNLAEEEELEEMRRVSLRINDFLRGLFLGIGIKLIDFKLEFGRVYDEEGNLFVVLADEISPDNCRLWDIKSGASLDKDLFRKDSGDLSAGYKEVATRLGVFIDKQKNVDAATVSKDDISLSKRKNVIDFSGKL